MKLRIMFSITITKNLISKLEKDSLEIIKEITLDELYQQIQCSKNNKGPCPDRFTNEFFKIFWVNIKFLLVTLLTFLAKEEAMNSSFLLGIMTCIPNGNKARNILKNWKPINFLNSIYKFNSRIWASSLKAFLLKLIRESQNWFVQGRFIGKNTRLT